MPSASKRPARSSAGPWATEVCIFEGSTREGLIRAGERARAYIAADAQVRLTDLAFTLNTRLGAGVAPGGPSSPESPGMRLAIVASTTAELDLKLAHALKLLAGPQCRRIKDRSGIYFFEEPLAREGKLAFLFPGEGSQYSGMLGDLCMQFPQARACFDRIDRAFIDHKRGYLPSHFIYPRRLSASDPLAQERRLWQMDGAVEAVFTANAALQAVLSNLEIHPHMLLGHSTGDYSALMAGGCITVGSEEDFARFMLDLNSLYERLAKNGEIPEASLVAVGSAGRAEVDAVIDRHKASLHVAMDNCPHQFVLCGVGEAVAAAVRELGSTGALCETLGFNRPYHTPMFQPVCDLLGDFYARVPMAPARIETWSCATVAPLPGDVEELRRLAVAQWAQPVRFRETIEAMYGRGVRLFVEVGPRGNLSAFVDDVLRGRDHLAVPADVRNRRSTTQLNHLVGMLAAHGVPMRLDYLYDRRSPRRLALDWPGREAANRAKVGARMTLATGWPLMRLSAETASLLRAQVEKAPSKPAELPRESHSSSHAAVPPLAAAPRGGIAAPEIAVSPIVETAAAPHQVVPADVAPPAVALMSPAGSTEQIVSTHLRTMERFLEVQEQIMRAFLGDASIGAQRVAEARMPEAPVVAAPLVFESTPPQAVRSAPAASAAPPASIPAAAPPEVKPPAPAVAPAAPVASAEAIAAILLKLVSDRTGYPIDMLDPKLDLEADLGIDSIKRVEILGSFQQQTGLMQQGDMELLSSRKTLREVIDFLAQRRPPAPEAVSAAQPGGLTASGIAEILVKLVSDRTGYPAEMVDLNLDLEADLGIDSIKRVEILGGFQQQTGVMQAGDMELLSSRKTLREVIDFLAARRPDAGTSPAPQAPAPSKAADRPRAFPLTVISRSEGRDLVAHCDISQQEARFLADHCLGREVSADDKELRGLPVMPLTMSMELLAEAASLLASHKALVGMRDVRIHRWMALDEDGLSLKLTASRRAQDAAEAIEVKLFDRAPGGDGRAPAAAIVEGTMIFDSSYPESPRAGEFALRAARPARWKPEQLYTEGMFHGPRFRGVVSVDTWGEDGAEATLRVLPVEDHFRSNRAPDYLTDPVLLDQPGQVVGFWTADHMDRGYVVFPFKLDELRLYGPRLAAGSTLKCRARIALIGDNQVRSDLDVVGPDGRIWARFIGWEDRRFDIPGAFSRLMLSPAETMLSAAWPAPASRLPEPGAFRCCRLGLDDFPAGFFEAHGGIWRRVLAFLTLSRREREIWRSLRMAPAEDLEWLLGRVAAKDAARLFLQQRHAIRACYADVEVVEEAGGPPRMEGAWSSQVKHPIALSISHSAGTAVAIAGDGRGCGLGVDIQWGNGKGNGTHDKAATELTAEEMDLAISSGTPHPEEWPIRLWCAKEAVSKALGRSTSEGSRGLMVSKRELETGLVKVALLGDLRTRFPELGGADLTAFTVREGNLIVATSMHERS